MSGKVYAVMSAVQGNGSKYAATNLANVVREKFKKQNKKVLMVDFDFENPSLAHLLVKHDKTHGIDNLLPHIHESGIREETFQENIISTKIGVDVLRGTDFIGKVKQFSKLHIETILNMAKKLYDYIFVVVSPKANNAGTVYTILHSDQVVLLLRNNETNALRIDKAIKLIEQYHMNENPVLLVYNFQNLSVSADVNEKLKDCPFSVKIAGVLDYEERTMDNANLIKKDSFFGSKSSNTKVFESIANQLV